MKYIPWNELPSVINQIESHFNQLSDHSSEMRFFSKKTPEMIRSWLDNMLNQTIHEHHWIMKMSPEGNVIGLGQISSDSKTTEIAISISDEYQGMGIGREILSKLIEKCKDLGYKKVFVCCLPSNKVVISILKSLGFCMEYDRFSNGFHGHLELV